MENTVNFRDMGGIASPDGRKVKEKRLLRSGQVIGLTEEEKDRLVNGYDLKTLVDFRTAREAESHPDDDLSGVRYVMIDIMEEAENKTGSMGSFEKVRSAEQVYGSMCELYRILAADRLAQAGYARFLRLALEQEEGALLFHCFAGKDRTGIGAAILLTLMDVPREAIFADYMLTNQMRAAENARIAERGRKAGKPEKELEIIHAAMSVRPEYLRSFFDFTEERYGSAVAYIKTEMGVSDADIARLKENYLA